MHSFNKSIGHIPVLISDFRKLFPKISGIWVDGTFGFGGYSKYLLEAGVEKLIVIDVDPDVKQHINNLQAEWPSKIDFHKVKIPFASYRKKESYKHGFLKIEKPIKINDYISITAKDKNSKILINEDEINKFNKNIIQIVYKKKIDLLR